MPEEEDPAVNPDELRREIVQAIERVRQNFRDITDDLSSDPADQSDGELEKSGS